MIDDIVNDFWVFGNFASMKDIRMKYNLIMDSSKFTSNKKILSEVIALNYHKVCKTLSFKLHVADSDGHANHEERSVLIKLLIFYDLRTNFT